VNPLHWFERRHIFANREHDDEIWEPVGRPLLIKIEGRVNRAQSALHKPSLKLHGLNDAEDAERDQNDSDQNEYPGPIRHS
jgi:hypothetical protein